MKLQQALAAALSTQRSAFSSSSSARCQQQQQLWVRRSSAAGCSASLAHASGGGTAAQSWAARGGGAHTHAGWRPLSAPSRSSLKGQGFCRPPSAPRCTFWVGNSDTESNTRVPGPSNMTARRALVSAPRGVRQGRQGVRAWWQWGERCAAAALGTLDERSQTKQLPASHPQVGIPPASFSAAPTRGAADKDAAKLFPGGAHAAQVQGCIVLRVASTHECHRDRHRGALRRAAAGKQVCIMSASCKLCQWRYIHASMRPRRQH